jgi:hypothetical protein
MMQTFKESQRFNQWWLWLILFIASGTPMYTSMCYNGKNGLPVSHGLMFSAGLFVFSTLLLRMFHLSTTIDEQGISYRMFPANLKPIVRKWEDIELAYVRRYSPIGEFGGWGIRYSLRGGRAYNISGDMGLQIVLKNGKKLLLGTRRPDEMSAALAELAARGIIPQQTITPPDSEA